VADIVLVHGLWNRGWSMLAMAKRLRNRGHDVMVFSYPTRGDSLDGHADALHAFINENWLDDSGCGELNLVGHSMGGLVILNMLARIGDLPGGRIVLMGTPVKGAAVVKRLEKLPGQNFLFGKVKDGLLQGFGQTTSGHETGVISGTRAFGFGQIAGKHGEPNDGTVAVSETRLDGVKDHVELEVAHSEMLVSSEVVQQVDHFLLHGIFEK
jgi:triacylglycerol esterase/lipase EstA (alpha/beta hydrolase family)